VLDAAKTGVGAPRLADVIALADRYGDVLDVVVDACQARLGPDAVAAYLQRGWLVQMTGSKFWGGPPFSGALLVPPQFMPRRGRLAPLLAGLSGYMARCEWPQAFAPATDGLSTAPNLGLIARWHAAIAEREAFEALEPAEAVDCLRRFAPMVADILSAHPALVSLPVEAMDRSALGADDLWAGLQTIVPVIPHRMVAGVPTPLSLVEAKRLHQDLGRDLSARFARYGLGPDEQRLAAIPCHVGQPVKLGATAALRLCASARTAVAMGGPDSRVREELEATAGKMALLLRHWEVAD
jgi:hypothetical protein